MPRMKPTIIRTRAFRSMSIVVAPLAALAVFTGIVLGQAQQQNPSRPPNNSTPGTATANTVQPLVYKIDRHQITLRPKEGIEYKYQMEKGTTMVYSWKSTGRVNHEFHGEPEGAPRGYADTYLKEDAKDQSHGTFLAPSTGIHGWYWENAGDQDVTVTITAAGFFSQAVTLSKAGRVPRELSNADAGK
jgi:hypothetical protein